MRSYLRLFSSAECFEFRFDRACARVRDIIGVGDYGVCVICCMVLRDIVWYCGMGWSDLGVVVGAVA